MAALVYNWNVEQGTSTSFVILYKDNAGEAVPLDGFQGRGQVRLKLNDPEPLCDIDVQVESNGTVTVSLPATALEAHTFRGKTFADRTQAVYDVEIYNADGVVHRLLNGYMYISPEVTKA